MVLGLVVGLLVGVAMAVGLAALRLPLAPSVALGLALGTLARNAVEARQKRHQLRWSAALAQAVTVGAAVWVMLAVLHG